VLGLDLGEQTLNAKGAGLHGHLVLSYEAFWPSAVSTFCFALLAAHSSVGALQPLKIACVFQSSYCCQGIATKTLLLACKPHSVRISRIAEAQGIAPCTASSAVELLPLGFCPMPRLRRMLYYLFPCPPCLLRLRCVGDEHDS
jgi:hypothetical protein